MNVAEAEFIHDHLFVFVRHLTTFRIHNHGSIDGAVELVLAITIVEERRDHTIQLPGSGGTSGIEMLPTDIGLERRLPVFR